MKIYKKLGIVIGLSSLMFVFMALALPKLATRTAAAAGPYTDDQVNGATFEFQDRGTIIGHFGSDTVNFTDSDPLDTSGTGTVQFKPPDGVFCKGDNVNYLLVQRSSFVLSKTASPPDTVAATVHLNFSRNGDATGCTQVHQGGDVRTAQVSGGDNALAYATWNNEDLLLVDGTTLHATSDPNEFEESPDKTCTGYVAIIASGQAVIYELNNSSTILRKTLPKTTDSSLNATKLAADFKDCYVKSINFTPVDTTNSNLGALAAQRIRLAGAEGVAAPGAAAGNDQASGDTCEANSNGFSMSWAVCPILDAASSATGSLEGLFEDQLSFSVDQLGSGQDKVQQSWALMRDIATGLLVIVALVMIISQAASFGPFDAYTIRKMLPKIVAAVILIQISWVLVKYSIDFINAIGKGVADLMYFPFGGPDNMGLFKLISNAHLTADTFTLGTFDWAAILVGGFLGYSFIFTMLGFGLMAVLALLVAFFTLVFRKLLIILLIIFAPLALLAWILPGTERYWKMWRDNLMKVLFMYPIVVAMIAAGRIFAYVVGDQPGNGGDFVALIFVLVGYFGPLFILPKTFKWGGQALGAASGAIQSAGTKAGAKPKAFMDKRQEGWSAERRRRSQERVSGKREYGKLTKPFIRPLDKFRSGQWDPTLGGPKSRRRFEADTQYKAAGRESSGKTFEAANAAAKQLLDTAADHDYVARMLMRGGEFEYLDKAGKLQTYTPPKGGKGYMRAAGAAAIAKYGTDGSNRAFQAEIDRMRAEGGEEAQLADEILDDNVGAMKGKMDSMYRGFNRTAYDAHLKTNPRDKQGAIRAARFGSIKASVTSMKDNWFDGMEGVEAQSLLAGLSHGLESGDAESAPLMEKLWQDYRTAVANPNIHVSPGVHKAFKAYADGNKGSAKESIDGINASRLGEIQDAIKGDYLRPDDGETERYGGDAGKAIKVRDAPVLDTIKRDDPANKGMIAKIGAGEFMQQFDAAGSPVGRSAATPLSPGEIKIQHGDAVTRTLPADTVLRPTVAAGATPAEVAAAAAASDAARQAFKIQLTSDRNVAQVLAHSIAYDVASPEHLQAIEDLRNDPATSATPEAKKAYNDIVTQIQQAYQERINETAAAFEARGGDAAAARAAATKRLAPQIIGLEATAPPPPPTPAGTPSIPDLRKLP